MINSWQPVQCDRPNVNMYERTSTHSKATIEHHDNGNVSASSKNGVLGLGTSVEADYFSPAPSDEKILDDMDKLAFPPKYGDWKEVKTKGPQLPNVKHYQGRETGGLIKSKINVTIAHDGDKTNYAGKVGHFGTEIEGTFFAPASDSDILERLSRNPKLDK
ncbi:hypothetical protein IJT93_04120 [bacterium]|nr:hypothetical protein [bacterium]